MNKKCFVDPSISISCKDVDFINSLDLDVINYDKNECDHREIEYFLLHSQCADQQLLEMKNCQYIGIRAHNTDYVNKRVTKQQGIQVQGLKNQHGINAVAELGKSFGMEILIAGKKGGHQFGEMGLDQVLKEADIVSLHLSSKQENNNYIGYEQLALMKHNSILINTARGSVLDYEALGDYLKQGKFLGVGLDVFDTEPFLNSPLTNSSNVILTPHSAYMTHETLDNMNNELLENLKAFITST